MLSSMALPGARTPAAGYVHDLKDLLDGLHRRSERRCSSHVIGNASAEPWACRRLASSATNDVVSGGFASIICASTETTRDGASACGLEHPVDPVLGDLTYDRPAPR